MRSSMLSDKDEIEDKEERKWEKGTSNPIPFDKYDKFKETLAEHSEKNRERNLMLFILARATGFRMGDLVPLTIGQLRDAIEYEELSIQESKQYEQWKSSLGKYPNRRKPKKRISPIAKTLNRYLKDYCKGKARSEFAFPSNKGSGNEYINQKSFSAILSEVGVKIGLENISGHSPRKTYATKVWEESNKDLESVRVALGHKSIEETKRYLGIKRHMIRSAAYIADDGI